MGDSVGNGQADEQPVRDVDISGFWIMRTEFTRDMFAQFVAATGYDTGNGCWIFDGGWQRAEGVCGEFQLKPPPVVGTGLDSGSPTGNYSDSPPCDPHHRRSSVV